MHGLSAVDCTRDSFAVVRSLRCGEGALIEMVMRLREALAISFGGEDMDTVEVLGELCESRR